MNRLIEGVKPIDRDSLEGLLACVAFKIETSLIDSGANSGDYTLVDLYTLSQPFVLEMYKENVHAFQVLGS